MPSSTGKSLVTCWSDRIGSTAGEERRGGISRHGPLPRPGRCRRRWHRFRVMAGGEGAIDLAQQRLLRRAAPVGQRAARMEGAAAGPPRHGGRRALDGAQPYHLALDPRRGRQQATGIGMARPVEDLVHRPALDHPPRIHDREMIGHAGHHAEVMGDEGEADAALDPQPRQHIQDLGLDGHVERRGRLVGDQQLRIVGHGHGDHGALAHAAGELVGILPDAALGKAGWPPAPAARRRGPAPSDG